MLKCLASVKSLGRPSAESPGHQMGVGVLALVVLMIVLSDLEEGIFSIELVPATNTLNDLVESFQLTNTHSDLH